jgi:hypothetical protein
VRPATNLDGFGPNFEKAGPAGGTVTNLDKIKEVFETAGSHFQHIGQVRSLDKTGSKNGKHSSISESSKFSAISYMMAVQVFEV